MERDSGVDALDGCGPHAARDFGERAQQITYHCFTADNCKDTVHGNVDL